MPDNQQFLQALFAEDAPYVHVTDFDFDPANIPSENQLVAWAGSWFYRYPMHQGTNQYFCISIFNPDDQGTPRRRKALFLRTRVIVLDDVREKLSIDAVNRLPLPSWILETSPGSEQWGYILDIPCADRKQVENLLDGLVANGLAPDGKDPGMKGVTRYVRLPDGYNTKASKMVNGQPFKCRMVEWHPDRKTSIESLAKPFHVNLDAPRREQRTDGAASVPDHPLLQIPDLIHVKETRSEGRFDITCPWVDTHTGMDDSGSAIFTNDDGTMGFKCHHGSCIHRNARDLIRWVEERKPGFGNVLSSWRAGRIFADLQQQQVSAPVIPEPTVSFMGESPAVAPPPPSMETLFDQLKRERHTSPEARALATHIIKIAEELPIMEQQHTHAEVCDLMHWTKVEFKSILKGLRSEWYSAALKDTTFLANFVYVKEQDRFYDYGSSIFFSPAAFQNSFSDIDADVKNNALTGGQVAKVDKLDFAPKEPRIFERKGVVYGNTWCASKAPKGVAGNCDWWLDHWDRLGWSRYRDHHLQWMAYTLKYPEKKINHIVMLGGMEGIGKDFLFFPLLTAMGDYAKTIEGNELLGDHNEYLFNTKLLYLNETELGDHAQAKQISSKLKPLGAQPPMTLRVNPKGITAVNIRNIVNVIMTTNDRLPFRLNSTSRRFHAAWSNVNVRDINEEMTPEWLEYWTLRWKWMEENVESCIYYLMNFVNLENFNPGAPPPMTDFLREIREASKSPAQVTIESFIRERFGAFDNDLLTASDASQTLRAAEMSHGHLLNVEASWFTPVRVGKILGSMSQCQSFRAVGPDNKHAVIWAIREAENYREIGPSGMWNAYQDSMNKIKQKTLTSGQHVKLAASN